MSLHCHSCYWEQDDFWDFSFKKYSYNPIKSFFGYDLGRWIIPRWEDHHPTEAQECGVIPWKWKPSIFIRVKGPEEWMNEKWYKDKDKSYLKKEAVSDYLYYVDGVPVSEEEVSKGLVNGKVERRKNEMVYGNRLDIFSWYILFYRFKTRLKRIFVWQRWWTANGWWFSKLIGKDFSWKDNPICPECGSKKLDYC